MIKTGRFYLDCGRLSNNEHQFIFEGYEIQKVIGEGRNGVVFLVRNIALNRLEALKIWSARDAGDERDKRVQGFREINAQASGRGNGTPIVYTAGERHGYFFAIMELVDGLTLKCWLTSERRSLLDRLRVGCTYADIAEIYGGDDLVHGDPHWNNVFVKSVYSVILLDFGTSIFTGHAASKNRHWNIVARTFAKLTAPFPFSDLVKTDEFHGFRLENGGIYHHFKERVYEWLLYMDIQPPARGLIEKQSNHNIYVFGEVKKILDKIDRNDLVAPGVLGAYWRV